MTTKTTLLPCPFCGGTRIKERSFVGGFVDRSAALVCECGCSLECYEDCYTDLRLTKEKWNKRHV